MLLLGQGNRGRRLVGLSDHRFGLHGWSRRCPHGAHGLRERCWNFFIKAVLLILTIGVDRFERSSIVDISARLPLDRPEIPGWSSGSPPFGSQHRFQRRSKPRGSRKTNELRDTIAIRMILGLALFLALFFVSATMSFWQANAGQNKIDNIIENLEPKRDIAFAMELNAVETEKNVLEYLRNR